MDELDTGGHAHREKKSMKEKVKGALGGLLGGKKHHGGSTDKSPSKESGYDTKSELGAHVTGPEGTMPYMNQYGGKEQSGYAGGNVFGPAGTGMDAYGAGENVDGVGKPKVDNSYEAWINEGRPRLQPRAADILNDRTKAGFERRSPGSDVKPNLGAPTPVYGDATKNDPQFGKTGFMDKVKDTITGQTPSHGIATGTATSGDATTGDGHHDPGVQGVSNVGTGGNRDKNGAPERNLEADPHVLAGHDTDPVDQMRHTVTGEDHGYGGEKETDQDGGGKQTVEDHGYGGEKETGETRGYGGEKEPSEEQCYGGETESTDNNPVRGAEGGLSALTGATNPQGEATLSGSKTGMQEEEGPRANDVKMDAAAAEQMEKLTIEGE